MHPAQTSEFLGQVLATSPVLARLFFASVEMIVLGCLVSGFLGLRRVRSPRIRALLWLLVLAKPLVALAVGPVFAIVRLGSDGPGVPTVSEAAIPPAHHVSGLSASPPASRPERLAAIGRVAPPAPRGAPAPPSPLVTHSYRARLPTTESVWSGPPSWWAGSAAASGTGCWRACSGANPRPSAIRSWSRRWNWASR